MPKIDDLLGVKIPGSIKGDALVLEMKIVNITAAMIKRVVNG